MLSEYVEVNNRSKYIMDIHIECKPTMSNMTKLKDLHKIIKSMDKSLCSEITTNSDTTIKLDLFNISTEVLRDINSYGYLKEIMFRR